MNRLRIIVVSAAVAGLLLAGTATAMATAPVPGGGSAFGRHVGSVAPEHPREDGPAFGSCISAMARGETCPHEH